MTFGKAELIKTISDDKLVEVNEGVAIGTKYLVNLDSIGMYEGYNTTHKKRWIKELVHVVNDTGQILGWYPTELLKISKLKG